MITKNGTKNLSQRLSYQLLLICPDVFRILVGTSRQAYNYNYNLKCFITICQYVCLSFIIAIYITVAV